MLQNNTVLALTSDLLANGAFSHLQDDEITTLHALILRSREPLSKIQQNLLLTFWYHADAGNIPSSLLYRCNTVLQQNGRSPIEELFVENDLY
jgi:hypothetical protein